MALQALRRMVPGGDDEACADSRVGDGGGDADLRGGRRGSPGPDGAARGAGAAVCVSPGRRGSSGPRCHTSFKI